MNYMTLKKTIFRLFSLFDQSEVQRMIFEQFIQFYLFDLKSSNLYVLYDEDRWQFMCVWNKVFLFIIT